jgi:hypothetical protein
MREVAGMFRWLLGDWMHGSHTGWGLMEHVESKRICTDAESDAMSCTAQSGQS